MISKQYRSEYSGEFVITHTIFRNGKKEQTREWIDNPIEVTSESKRACCIAKDAITGKIPLIHLQNHTGGLLHRNRMQLYAAEELWNHIKADFTVVLEQSQLDEIKSVKYQEQSVIYTSSARCIANPGDFYLIPLGSYYPSAVTTVWLSCFDGHKEVYLYGYNTVEMSEKSLILIRDIMQAYDDVHFQHVYDRQSPDAWMRCINFETINTRQFISTCDV